MSQEHPVTSSSLAEPTRARHWVIVFATTLAVITYIDRVCISQAAPKMQEELGLTARQMGYVFSAFGWAYSLFEIPGGWLGDKFGPRKVLMRVVCMWSFFTAATGWAWNLWSLLVTRFLFGVGEAGCFPNLAKAYTNWLPRSERSRAVGIMWLSARWGGAFTPLLVVWVISQTTWRHAFEIFGVIGIVWAIIFFWWFRDDPRNHGGVNAAELELLKDRQTSGGHVKVPWLLLARSPTVWLLWFQYFCFGYGWYFYITWLPTYLKDARHLQFANVALLAGLPLFFGGIGSMLSGWLAGSLGRRGFDVARTRRGICYVAFWGAAVLSFISPYVPNPVLGMLVMGFASFCMDLAITVGWNACMDVGGKYAGTISGGMNMAGNLGGAVGPLAVGYILSVTNNNWLIPFWISAIFYVIGGLSWIWIDPVTPLEEPEHEALGFAVLTENSTSDPGRTDSYE
jgi:MFS transporter, ACS family, glucarate transporter